MTKKINFAIGIHNHQPVGNFNAIFKEAFNKAYIPFLNILERHPRIKINLHFSGPLIDYMAENYPSLVKSIRKMVKRGQIEILAGAYYEPILTNLLDHDIKGQINKYLESSQKLFKFKPQGMWTAERVWEPSLAKSISQSEIKYTLLDESHFRYAGLNPEEVSGYYITEEKGYPLYIFPISFKLRYYMPFQIPEKTIEFLSGIATEAGDNLATFGDDGEKFGIWPGTFDTVYNKGWLEKFFSLLEKNKNWINLVHFSEFIKKHTPRGRIYLPTASYFEMTQWALPGKVQAEFEKTISELKEKNLWDRYEPFLKGGFWRNFLAKYDESNNIQKKSICLSKKIIKLKGKKKKQALEELWKGQCNCAYWHGVFGGLYLPHLRDALYKHLIRAEKIIDSALIKKRKFIQYEVDDYNNDSFDEVIIKQNKFNLYFSPQRGGTLYELDIKEKDTNLINTLKRRYEAYHEKISSARKENNADSLKSIHDLTVTKEENLDKHLNYDKYPKHCLLDHILAPQTTLEDFKTARFHQDGDFALKPYKFKIKKQRRVLVLELSREAFVKFENNFYPFKIQKNITVCENSNQLTAQYLLENPSGKEFGIWFASEFNFNFLNYRDENSGLFFESGKANLHSTGCAQGVQKVPLEEAGRLKFEITVSPESSLWHFPIETVSISEGGFEKIYQGTTLLFHWRLHFKKRQRQLLKVILSF